MHFRSANVLRGAVMLTSSLVIVTTATAIAQTDTFAQTETIAPSETVLYSFCSLTNCSDGYLPSGELIRDTKGNLYGTTYYGGTGNCLFDGGCGTVFKVSPNGTERVLHSFAFGGRDGYNPEARLLADAKGNLYSTTLNGGTNGGGTVFELSPGAKGVTEKILYSFPGSLTDGYSLYGGLIRDAKGNLYGTTGNGGTGVNPARFQSNLLLTSSAVKSRCRPSGVIVLRNATDGQNCCNFGFVRDWLNLQPSCVPYAVLRTRNFCKF